VSSGVTFGAQVVVHDGTRIGDRVTVGDRSVLGKPVVRSVSLGPPTAPLEILDDVRIGTGVIVCAGAIVGAGAMLDDLVNVRDGARIGAGTQVGRGAGIGANAEIGDGVVIGAGVWITSWTVIEDDVIVGPHVVTMNDDRMARLPAGSALHGPVLRRGCRIGAGARLTPGVEIGAGGVVAAGSLVRRDVAPGSRVDGVPAYEVR
jgi:UDP-2-acetamido-3-amino-2,3-dideoxy-glucuronate N-acetyltransferase